jgi:hypothetical protein
MAADLLYEASEILIALKRNGEYAQDIQPLGLVGLFKTALWKRSNGCYEIVQARSSGS